MRVGWKTLGRPPRVLVTGTTGFIGSFLVEAMLREGCHVYCLTRPGLRAHTALKSRVIKAIRTVNPHSKISNISVLKGDVTQPFAGLQRSTINSFRKKVDEIWHCAAETSLNENLRERVLRTNFGGTRNMVALAEEIECPSFCFISTAFVYDALAALAAEEPARHRNYRNAYEESKQLAENYLIERTASDGFVGTIFRLPVTTGHSESGLTSQFLGYYYYARLFSELRRRLLRKLDHRDLAECLADQGVRFIAGKLNLPLSPAGYLKLPIRFFCEPLSTVNINPVDLVVKTLLRCAASPRDCTKILHVTNGNPPKCRFLFQETLRLFGFKGFEIASIREHSYDPPLQDSGFEASLAGIEESIYSATLPYLSYTLNEPEFSRANLESMIGHENLPDFNVDAKYLWRILDYAVSHEFGKKRKEQ